MVYSLGVPIEKVDTSSTELCLKTNEILSKLLGLEEDWGVQIYERSAGPFAQEREVKINGRIQCLGDDDFSLLVFSERLDSLAYVMNAGPYGYDEGGIEAEDLDVFLEPGYGAAGNCMVAAVAISLCLLGESRRLIEDSALKWSGLPYTQIDEFSARLYAPSEDSSSDAGQAIRAFEARMAKGRVGFSKP